MDITREGSLFDPSKPNYGRVFDDQSGLLNWDEQNPGIYETYKEIIANHWTADDVSLRQDLIDYKRSATEADKEMAHRAISKLVVLDSIAAKVGGALFYYVKNLGVSHAMIAVANQETIHNESYTKIEATLVDQEHARKVFEIPKNDEEIQNVVIPIIDVFDDFMKEQTPEKAAKAMVALSLLEGVPFTNGFVPFYHLGEHKKIFAGIVQIIAYINRDEVKHAYLYALIVRTILSEYSDEIDTEAFKEWCYDLFNKVVPEEQKLSHSIFKDATEIDDVVVEKYIEFRANSLLVNLGYEGIFATKRNPMRWINQYDPKNTNNKKDDFFERKPTNYKKVGKNNHFDDL